MILTPKSLVSTKLALPQEGARSRVEIYEFINGSWTKLGIDLDGEADGDQFGYSVSMNDDGTRVAVSAIFVRFIDSH